MLLRLLSVVKRLGQNVGFLLIGGLISSVRLVHFGDSETGGKLDHLWAELLLCNVVICIRLGPFDPVRIWQDTFSICYMPSSWNSNSNKGCLTRSGDM